MGRKRVGLLQGIYFPVVKDIATIISDYWWYDYEYEYGLCSVNAFWKGGTKSRKQHMVTWLIEEPAQNKRRK